MKVAIMQPTFLPWLGYFSLINSVDKFVFLDIVQFENRSWQQRNRILNNNQVQWVTVPVSLPTGQATKIKEVKINHEHYSASKIIKTLEHAYSKAEWTKFTLENVGPRLKNAGNSLSELNMELVVQLSPLLGIETEFVYAGELEVTGEKADLLLDICQKIGATTYISPVGSRVYLDDFNGFNESQIQVEYQEYTHPAYKQLSTSFVSHLSIVDALCNIGIKETASLI
jgi:hypothetical protein